MNGMGGDPSSLECRPGGTGAGRDWPKGRADTRPSNTRSRDDAVPVSAFRSLREANDSRSSVTRAADRKFGRVARQPLLRLYRSLSYIFETGLAGDFKL